MQGGHLQRRRAAFLIALVMASTLAHVKAGASLPTRFTGAYIEAEAWTGDPLWEDHWGFETYTQVHPVVDG
jgi:hypothetical protein